MDEDKFLCYEPIIKEELDSILNDLETNAFNRNFNDSAFNVKLINFISKEDIEITLKSLKIISLYLKNVESVSKVVIYKILMSLNKIFDTEDEEIAKYYIEILDIIYNKFYEYVDFTEDLELKLNCVVVFLKNFINGKFDNADVIMKTLKDSIDYLWMEAKDSCIEILLMISNDIILDTSEKILSYIKMICIFLNSPNMKLYTKAKFARNIGSFIIKALQHKSFQYSDSAFELIWNLTCVMITNYKLVWIPTENKTKYYACEQFINSLCVVLTTLTSVILPVHINQTIDTKHPQIMEIVLDCLLKINNDDTLTFTEEGLEKLQFIITKLRDYNSFLESEAFIITYIDEISPGFISLWRTSFLILTITNDCFTNYQQFFSTYFDNCLKYMNNCLLKDVTQYTDSEKLKFRSFFMNLVPLLSEMIQQHSEKFNHQFRCYLEFYSDMLNNISNKLIQVSSETGLCNSFDLLSKYCNIIEDELHPEIKEIILKLVVKHRLINTKPIKKSLLRFFLEYFLFDELNEILTYPYLIDMIVTAVMDENNNDSELTKTLTDKLIFPLAKSEDLRSKIRVELFKAGYNGPLLIMLSF